MRLEEKMGLDTLIDLEFAFVSWDDSCRNLYAIDRCCRRPAGHAPAVHASGFGTGRVWWAE